MQIKTRTKGISLLSGQGIHGRERAFRNPIRDIRSRKKVSDIKHGTCFLKTKFRNIINQADIAERNEVFENNNIDKDLSLKYLLESAQNYCKLLGKEFNPVLTDNIHDNILIVYNEFTAALPNGFNINIDVNLSGLKHLYFVLYTDDNFPSEFLFLPIKATQKMTLEIKDVFLEFVKFYSDSQGVYLPYDHMDYSYIIEEMFQEIIDFPEEQEQYDIDRAKSYMKGIIPDTFKKLHSFETTADKVLNKCINLKNSASGKDLNLLNVMLYGIPLLKSNCITNFGYDYSIDNLTPDYSRQPMVDFERTLAIVWDDDDYAGQWMQEGINADIGEFSCVGPADFVLLNPNSKELLKPSEYPKQFYDWFCKLFEKISDYESTDRTNDK